MTKHLKQLALFLILIVLSSMVLACKQNDNTFNDYQQKKKQEIESYMTTKLQDNYTEENRTTLNNVIATFNKSIDNAKNTDEIDSIVTHTKQAMDMVEPLRSATLNNGAYFLTETGYEWYKTKHISHHDETLSKQMLWVIIVDKQITVSKGERTAYTIAENNGIYRGISFVSYIDIWTSNNILYLRDKNETLQYTLDPTYDASTVSQTEQLSAPTDIDVIIDNTEPRNITLTWKYSNNYGYFGCGVELKNTENTEFTPIKIERPYMNTLVVQLFTNDYLKQGENLVRLSNIGGYWINTSKNVSVSLSSSYATFKVSIADGGISVEQI